MATPKKVMMQMLFAHQLSAQADDIVDCRFAVAAGFQIRAVSFVPLIVLR